MVTDDQTATGDDWEALHCKTSLVSQTCYLLLEFTKILFLKSQEKKANNKMFSYKCSKKKILKFSVKEVAKINEHCFLPVPKYYN